MSTIYNGYRIKPVTYQQTRCYAVTTPSGEQWRELAANIKTAKRWIDAAKAAGSAR